MARSVVRNTDLRPNFCIAKDKEPLIFPEGEFADCFAPEELEQALTKRGYTCADMLICIGSVLEDDSEQKKFVEQMKAQLGDYDLRIYLKRVNPEEYVERVTPLGFTIEKWLCYSYGFHFLDIRDHVKGK